MPVPMILKTALLGAALLVLPPLAPQSGDRAVAQGCNCGALWYQRNAIFASQGHCFKTRRGIAVFGRNCFPPFGRLTRAQRRQVNRIIRAERACGCR